MKVALVCDFFHPRLGGVEIHIWSLSHRLVRVGHQVIVVTHAYPERTGVRYLPGPVKVYHCPMRIMTDDDCLPTFTATFPLFRWIMIREAVQIVHAHQATSTLANEALLYATHMGIPTAYTDHSLFGFDDVASLLLNRVLQTTLSTVDAAICVSHTCRENLIARANITDPAIVTVIPNAIDSSKFTPDPTKRSNDRITIVVVSRLVYRKGVDLLVGIIPRICAMFSTVDFIIGGDGGKRLLLEEMVERERLQERVEFLGAVPHAMVRSVLVRGHVFLNCSLTESFCIAIVEAASCGLFVVSTDVGGVPEVLPPDMILLSEPSVTSLVHNLAHAISDKTVAPNNNDHSWRSHDRIKSMYSWNYVTRQTVKIYERILVKRRLSSLERFQRNKTVLGGGIAGYVACVLAITIHLYGTFVEWCQPREWIDVVPNLN